MEYFFLVVAIIISLFVVLHLRPLTENEVKSLGVKRRKYNIEEYFHADNTEKNVNPNFKKTLNPNGMFYRVDLPLYSTASTVAGLLKYKKHEWIVVAFEKQKLVEHLWVNKGHNKSSASIFLPLNQVIDTAVKNGYSSVIMFHNHPNSNPSTYNCTQASKIDLDTASLWANTLNPKGISLVEYVCERGRSYRYFLSPSEYFLPISGFISDINRTNGNSKFGNLWLHTERIFLKDSSFFHSKIIKINL